MNKQNTTEITKDNGTVVLISYKTPVAAFVPGAGFYKTDVKYSSTTTKHVNKWLVAKGADMLAVTKITQDFLDGLL